MEQEWCHIYNRFQGLLIFAFFQSYVLEIVLTLETAVEHMKEEEEEEEGVGQGVESAQQPGSLPPLMLGVGVVSSAQQQQQQQQQQALPSSSQQLNPTQSLPVGMRKHSDVPPMQSESEHPYRYMYTVSIKEPLRKGQPLMKDTS